MSILEVNLSNFNYNIDNIQKYIGNKKIMPVIKANAYGTYINKRIDVLNRFDVVAVAMVKEAVELRNLGYTKEIFILNEPSKDEIDDIIKYNIIAGICDKSILKELIKTNANIKIHLEIETGMNRTGIKLDDLNEFVNLIRNTNIKVEGVYTHLSSADKDEDYTLKQLSIFKNAVDLLKNYFDLKYIHSCASNGLLNYNDNISNTVRPGLIMYGYQSFDGVYNLMDLKPVCKLKSKIIFIKEIERNDSVGYSRTFISDRKMKIATIRIGYADGYRRELSNRGKVVINGIKCNVIGNVCMDNIMVDITGVDANVDDFVYIFDNDLITIDDIAKECNTINYEILTNISERVERTFIC